MILCACDAADQLPSDDQRPSSPVQRSAAGESATTEVAGEPMATLLRTGEPPSASTETQTIQQTDAESAVTVQPQEEAAT